MALAILISCCKQLAINPTLGPTPISLYNSWCCLSKHQPSYENTLPRSSLVKSLITYLRSYPRLEQPTTLSRNPHSQFITSMEPAKEKNETIIARAKNLANVPWCDEYEKMISGML